MSHGAKARPEVNPHLTSTLLYPLHLGWGGEAWCHLSVSEGVKAPR